MKILIRYLKPYKWLVVLALLLAAINQTFSMLDPFLFGRLLDTLGTHPHEIGTYSAHKVFHKISDRSQSQFVWTLMGFLGMLISVAMISRIAKAFQDYFGNVIVQKFGATIFTDGLRHSMGLPFRDFEDQRSGETLSTLSKVRIDTEKFISLLHQCCLRDRGGGGLYLDLFVFAALVDHAHLCGGHGIPLTSHQPAEP